MFEIRPGDLELCHELGLPVYKGRWFYPTWARAAAAGVVHSLARLANGIWITVDHEDGYRTQYGHLAEPEVNVKDEVKRGQRIAGPCDVHRMSPPHLHAGLGLQRHWGHYLDPVPWLKS